MALITIYDDMKDLEKYTNLTVEDFEDELEENNIETLTLGAYTGVSEDFNPLDLTEGNIHYTLRTYLETTAQGPSDEDIEALAQYAFAIATTKEIYLKY